MWWSDHCFTIHTDKCWMRQKYSSVRNITAFVGAHTITDGTRHALARITRHPNYNSARRANDIAVLRIATQIQFNDFVQSIALPALLVIAKLPGVVAGWGNEVVSEID